MNEFQQFPVEWFEAAPIGTKLTGEDGRHAMRTRDHWFVIGVLGTFPWDHDEMGRWGWRVDYRPVVIPDPVTIETAVTAWRDYLDPPEPGGQIRLTVEQARSLLPLVGLDVTVTVEAR